jgi:hypothetical protein
MVLAPIAMRRSAEKKQLKKVIHKAIGALLMCGSISAGQE